MGLLEKNKLNKILTYWPKNSIVTTTWLHEAGISNQLIYKYKRSRWIIPFGHGAFMRTGDSVDWRGATFGLQQQLTNDMVHIGGKSALEIRGLAHFLRFNGTQLDLFGELKSRLPSWYIKNNWGAKIYFTRYSFLPPKIGIQKYLVDGFDLYISSPERSILELLHFVPTRQSFEEALLIFENLRTLRPDLLKTLLEHCRSIKIKRLFFFLAEHLQHDWLKELEISTVNFGKGNRVIVPAGHLHQKYKITIPRNLKPLQDASELP